MVKDDGRIVHVAPWGMKGWCGMGRGRMGLSLLLALYELGPNLVEKEGEGYG